MLTLICVRRAADPPPAEGLHVRVGQPVELVAAGPLAAWVCPGELSRDLDGIRVHEGVVRAALRSATPLPVRFGTAFANVGALRAMLEQREGEFLEVLARVDGKVEMGVRMSWAAPQTDAAPGEVSVAEVTSGREYLEARRRALRITEELSARAAQLVERLSTRLAPGEVPMVHQLLPQRGVAATMAHLVQRQGVGEYRERAEAARFDFPEVTFHVTGPWAPYSFV